LSIYVLGGGSCDPKLARTTISDYKEAGNDLIAVTSEAGWLHPIAKDLGIAVHPVGASLEYSSTDTVIAPLDQDGLEDILKTGAVVLDLTDGLMPLELTEEPGEIPEVPDVPDVLPDPPTAEAPEPTTVEETTEDKPKRAPRSRKKPVVDPLPEPAKPAKPVEPDVVTIPTANSDDNSAGDALDISTSGTRTYDSAWANTGTTSWKLEGTSGNTAILGRDRADAEGAASGTTITTAITDDLEAFIPAQWSETPESREVRLVRQLVQLHTENADLDTLYVVLDLLRDKKQ